MLASSIFKVPETMRTEPKDYSRKNGKMADDYDPSANPRDDETSSDEDEVGYTGHPTLVRLNTKWHLRGRGSSEQSSQPLPAPSGDAAQKAENFRKFYQAVRSPTHVRVTAGGRIV